MSTLTEYTRTLPLAITENDGHVDIHCTATPEQNNGKPCVWRWRLASESDAENGVAVGNAIQHAWDLHMRYVKYPWQQHQEESAGRAAVDANPIGRVGSDVRSE